MNILVPIAFSLLAVAAPGEDREGCVEVGVADADIEMIAATDSVAVGDIRLVVSDVLTTNGGSRRIIVSELPDGTAVDILDGGPWGGEGFLDAFYVTDRKSETISAWLKIADANPVVTEAPEGGLLFEFTDRLNIVVLNHDTSEKETFVLRDNQITYRMNDDGHFSLVSIRPKPDDRDALARYLRIYDLNGPNPDTPVDGTYLAAYLSSLFPLPGKLPSTQ